MKKPDDDLKLDINEIFGGDWTKMPEAEPTMPEAPPSILPESIEDVPGTDIKFNDETSSSISEPVVITVISKVHRTNDKEAETETLAKDEPPKKASVQVSGSSLLLQPGVSGSGTNEPVNVSGSSLVMKPGVSARKEPTFEDFINAYDRFRSIFFEELKNTIDVRKISNMFVKTFEAARERHLDVLRNTNWDSSGNLLEDGSLNVQRMLDNKNALDPKQAEVMVDNALLFLFNLRIQAVEKGLGPEYGGRVKSQIRKWIEMESKKEGSGKSDPRVLQHLSNFLL